MSGYDKKLFVTEHNTGMATIVDAIQELLLDTESAGRSAQTVRFYRQQLCTFADWCAKRAVTDVGEITPALLRQYMVARRRADLSPDTADAAYRALRRFFYFLVEVGVIHESPLAHVARSRQKLPVKSSFRQDEIAKLIEGSGLAPRDHAFVLFLLDTGCRVGESLNIRWHDINFADDTDDGASVFLQHTKNGMPRLVPMSAQAVQALRRHKESLGNIRPDQPVWVNTQTGERLTTSGARQLCNRIAKQLGIGHANPHKFRRTFAIEMLRNGGDVVRLSQLLGHANVSLLLRYLPLTDRDLRDVHHRAGPLSRFEPDQYRG